MKTKLVLLAVFSVVLLSSCQKEITLQEETQKEIYVQPTWEVDTSDVERPQEVKE